MLPQIAAAVIIAALAIYSVSGGADFGAGLWSLIASGRRAEDQRRLVDDAIAPIWEANHVWLILVVVLLFVCFPLAYSTASIALHIPITLMLIGVVLRGSAFAFRHYAESDTLRERWGRVFAMTSVLTPLFLGICLGAVVTGRITTTIGSRFSAYIDSWATPFPIAVGIFTLALFSFCAAVYLTNETSDRELQEIFRRRAMVAGVIAAALSLALHPVGLSDAPEFTRQLLAAPWGIPLRALSTIAGVGTMVALQQRRYRLARMMVIALIAFIVAGFGYAQQPFMIRPEVTIANAAAPLATLRLTLLTLGAGTVLLAPSFFVLFRVFKGSRSEQEGE